jgi:CDP-paratose 2-epimerase
MGNKKYVLITGSDGLIGSESVKFFSRKGYSILGIDNNSRMKFFGKEASVLWNRSQLKKNNPNYIHFNYDIRNSKKVDKIFQDYKNDIVLIIHTAAQPSHDWAASNPKLDYEINSLGTLNLLESYRKNSPKASFIFTSTNKVYGDNPNKLDLVEDESRYKIRKGTEYEYGINESMSIDNTLHSLFGASKTSADILVQEYGKYFGLKTVSFRGGCLTGPSHSGTSLHGFLSYLMKCIVTGEKYTIYGYKGKQVRDNIHSSDLVKGFYEFYQNPKSGEVYNIGGGMDSNCSMLEAISIGEKIVNKEMYYEYSQTPRTGDHVWYVSDLSKFKKDYPSWNITYGIEEIMNEIYLKNMKRWTNN